MYIESFPYVFAVHRCDHTHFHLPRLKYMEIMVCGVPLWRSKVTHRYMTWSTWYDGKCWNGVKTKYHNPSIYQSIHWWVKSLILQNTVCKQSFNSSIEPFTVCEWCKTQVPKDNVFFQMLCMLHVCDTPNIYSTSIVYIDNYLFGLCQGVQVQLPLVRDLFG